MAAFLKRIAAHTKLQKPAQLGDHLWDSIQCFNAGFAVFDARSILTTANKAFLDPFAHFPDMAVGTSYSDMLDILLSNRIIDTEGESHADWKSRALDRWALTRPYPLTFKFANGRHVKMVDRRTQTGETVSLVFDVTDQISTQFELEAARQKAEHANKSKSAFLANMSHEIRTPMNGVVGMADLLSESDLSDEQRLYVETIKNSGEALLVIINDVLDYSKIEANKLTLNPEPFDLERSIHEVVMLLQPIAVEKGLDLLVDYDMFLPAHFNGDPGRIRQILTNLIGNAIKFTAQGHVLVRATGYQNDAGAHNVHITVEDTGLGIPKDQQAGIFGEFQQVQNSEHQKIKGTGLGLSISKRLIQLMNGNIWLESEEGVGSCFGFSIPLQKTNDPSNVDIEKPKHIHRVLVLDDLAVNRSILKKQLSAMSIKTVTCASVDEALHQLDTDADGFDYILTDMAMPDKSGLEFAQILDARGIKTPRVLMTSNPKSELGDDITKCFTNVLQKPISRRDVFRCFSDAEAFKVQTTTKQENPIKASGRKLKILSADDNKTNRLVFEKMTQHIDMELVFATNGQEAVDLYQSFKPDMIFMDISMPIMDGKQATQAIRKLEEVSGTHTPICAMTAHAMDGDREAILNVGLDDYLTKPIRKAEISSKIQDLTPKNFESDDQVG